MASFFFVILKVERQDKGAKDLEEQKLKRILEYVWIAVVLLVGYYFLKDKSKWVLFLMTFLLAGLGALFINFFFDSVTAWKKKKKETK
ncbi:hypothetical protein BG07_1539 [Bacillus pseudomycoides]|nr:hypothetical protein DJ92_3405 [Bacillus pseudomycoides]AJI17055.1 hypothetical protein BG07_1539 [Bacillus pseudomycoides]